jgi:hypothetical protein
MHPIMTKLTKVDCLHSGKGSPLPVNSRVFVGANEDPIIDSSSVYVIAGCSFPPPIIANGPCVMARWQGFSSRVFTNSVPVLLAKPSGQGLCMPTGMPTLPPKNLQARVLGK